MQRVFEVSVAFGFSPTRSLRVMAGDAMEAVIMGLCELGLTTLMLVTGITICEL